MGYFQLWCFDFETVLSFDCPSRVQHSNMECIGDVLDEIFFEKNPVDYNPFLRQHDAELEQIDAFVRSTLCLADNRIDTAARLLQHLESSKRTVDYFECRKLGCDLKGDDDRITILDYNFNVYEDLVYKVDDVREITSMPRLTYSTKS